jgi:D-psicose/D-tagatose/L-ribulose 3-epimerase
MKLSVSNIAWTEAQDEASLAALSRFGVEGVEVAPTRLWPAWAGMSAESARAVRDHLRERGFAIPAMQSLLFGLPDLNLFGDSARREALRRHLESLFPVAAELGARVLVFGSPKNRDRGDIEESVALALAADFFRELARSASAHDVVLCIEPNPPQYASNFVTGWRQALALVEAVNTMGFGLHLDTGCIVMNGDDPADAISTCGSAIQHFHISEPHLSGFDAPVVDHASVSQALRAVDYRNWISIEMRSNAASVAALEGALAFVQKTYVNPESHS